jgi:hypothetical protein
MSEDALEQMKEYAAARSLTLGEAASLLVKRAIKQSTQVRKDGNFFVFPSGDDKEIVTLEHSLKIEDESE